MNSQAQRIVDKMLESSLSPEEMSDFVGKSLYTFDWRQVLKAAEIDGMRTDEDFGQWHCEFRILAESVAGAFDLQVQGYRVGIAMVSFSTSLDTTKTDASGRKWPRSLNTRYRAVEVNWPGIDQLKSKFEEWVRGPLTDKFAQGGMSKARLVPLVSKLQNSLAWRPAKPLATPEEVEQLKQRFDYGNDKTDTFLHNCGMFDDPRTEGRETDYNYITSEDVQFWNALADEYEAKDRPKG